MQNAATPTYAVSEAVLNLINSDPNIREEARTALWNRYNSQGQSSQRVGQIDAMLSAYEDGRASAVESGIEEEITSLKNAREEFVQELDGTGEVGRQ